MSKTARTKNNSTNNIGSNSREKTTGKSKTKTTTKTKSPFSSATKSIPMNSVLNAEVEKKDSKIDIEALLNKYLVTKEEESEKKETEPIYRLDDTKDTNTIKRFSDGAIVSDIDNDNKLLNVSMITKLYYTDSYKKIIDVEISELI